MKAEKKNNLSIYSFITNIFPTSAHNVIRLPLNIWKILTTVCKTQVEIYHLSTIIHNAPLSPHTYRDDKDDIKKPERGFM